MNIVSGNCIRVFIKDENRLYKPIAYEMETNINVNIDYDNVYQMEDDDVGVYEKRIDWDISGSSLVEEDPKMLDYILNNDLVYIVIGVIPEGSQELPEYGYVGRAYFTNIEVSANTGEVCEYQYELAGYGPLKRGRISDLDPDIPIDFTDDRTIPEFEFTDNEGSFPLDIDNDYEIADLVNPNELPYRVKIERIE